MSRPIPSPDSITPRQLAFVRRSFVRLGLHGSAGVLRVNPKTLDRALWKGIGSSTSKENGVDDRKCRSA